MSGRADREDAYVEGLIPPADMAPSARRSMLALAVLTGSLLLPAATRAGDVPAAKAPAVDAPIRVLEAPHPDILIDRLIDPRIQQSLNLVPQYRKFREGPQFRQVQAVANLIAGKLGTTWDRGLRDLTGGGIAARVAIDAGRPPRLEAVVTPTDPKLLEKFLAVFVDLARQDARNKKTPDPVRTADHGGKTMYFLGAKDQEIGYAVVAGRLVVANSKPGLESLVDRVEKSGASAVAGASSSPNTGAPVVLRGHLDLARLRKLDPKKFTLPARPDTGVMLFFGSWYETLKQAAAVDATVRWSGTELAADLDLPLAGGDRPAAVKGYLPGQGEHPAPPLHPPGTIASLSLWRDWATIWEARADLLPPETVQGLAQFDTLAGQFFGAREFGPDVLGAFDPHWRLVIAQQDYAAMKPAPDTKLPAFAVVAELGSSQENFADRLKVAFQAIIGISNVDAAQKRAAALELGSENVDGIPMTTTKFILSTKSTSPDEPGAQRYNYSPSIAHVGRYFILSSSAGLARSLIRELKADSDAGKESQKSEPATFTVNADGPELARLFEKNRDRMIMQTMLSRGETKEDAGRRVDLNLALLRYLGHGRLVIQDLPGRSRAQVRLDLSR
ncbi:MAG: hypothetical protein ACYC61_07685 [Isosphaeraceae bacterium]